MNTIGELIICFVTQRKGISRHPIHSRLVFLCNVAQEVIAGDCIFFVCNVNEILADETQRHIYTWGNSKKLEAVKPRSDI